MTDVAEDFPLYPLDSPGMPLPGPDFVNEAVARGDAPAEIDGKGVDKHLSSYGEHLAQLYRRALYDPEFSLPVRVKFSTLQASFVVGHIWGMHPDGPRPSEVMIIGKHPGPDELAQRRNFVGPASADLYRVLDELQVPTEVSDTWYITNFIKHNRLDPASNNLAKTWEANCAPILQQELRLVQPKYILCLGSEAGKHLLGMEGAVGRMAGRVVDYRFPTHMPGEPATMHTAKLMVITHPAAVWHDPVQYDNLRAGMAQFWQLTQGQDVGRLEPDIIHRNIYTERLLKQVVDQILADPDPASRVIAVDCEWHGDRPREQGAYLRTIQFSHKPKHGYCVVLRDCGGALSFKPGIDRALYHLTRLLKSTPERKVRIGGHFFRSDIPWLLDFGIDLRSEYAPPCTGDREAEAELTRTEGGWDTGNMAHAVCETGDYGLEMQAARFTTAPRYDIQIELWKKKYCREHDMADKDLEGYGDCPNQVLHSDLPLHRPSYAGYDPDVTRRLFDVYNGTPDRVGKLDHDQYGNCSRVPYVINMHAGVGFLEMEMTGIAIDKTRGDELTHQYMEALAENKKTLRRMIEWPGFNPDSDQHRKELLFGEALNGKKDKETGLPVRLRPEGAMALNLTPIMAAGKECKTWERVIKERKSELYNPSTGKETLGILGRNNNVIWKLRDVRFLGQILKGVLRKPRTDKKTGLIQRDEEGFNVYDDGLMVWEGWDGRVRTHIFPKETGRISSARVALQNISKRREADYERILGEEHYKFPLRSILCASPGCVLVEADLKSAELAGIAWLCGDETMIEHVRRNMLPEDHPDYLDIHSATAVRAFQLNCEPTKQGLKDAGLKHLRVAAKNVNFGIPYQRGAEALQRQCREEGAIVTIEETEQLKDGYFDQYPNTYGFLEDCKSRVVEPGFLYGAFGRLRRFPRTDDRKILAEMQREACNFPVQNLVADAVNLAIHNLMLYRARGGHGKRWFNLLLQIHDALLFEVPIPYLDWLVDDVIPSCMTQGVPVVPRHLDGTLMDVDPYYFGTDTEVYVHWGQELGQEEARALNIPSRYAHAA